MHDALIGALARVDRPGEFCAAGDLPMTLPGLTVEGLGALSLPLAEAQARELIGLCRQAPYGKGVQTLVDTSVRRVWQLEPDRLQFTNPHWETTLGRTVEEVREKLGLERSPLVAHLHDLLVYERGSFFLPHRDGEKLDRMVATLVIVLPSAHEGGELVVSHNGERYEIAFPGAASGFELSYAAFYADCEHEVRPIQSGYRLCLTYNLVLAKPGRGKRLGAPSYGPVVDEASDLLTFWCEDRCTQKIAVALDHLYTQDGLTPDALKGTDRARAEVLFQAARRAQCVAHLALVTLWKCNSAEYAYHRPYSRWRRYGDWDESEGTGDVPYETGEIIDSTLTAEHWLDRAGRKAGFGSIPLDEDEIVSASPLDAGEPSEEEFEGFTGNAGMTVERWYRRAAVVIWPREEHYAVLCEAGTVAGIGGLEQMVRQLRRSPGADFPARREACLAFAAAIVESWKGRDHGGLADGQDALDPGLFPALLCELDDPGLLCRFIREVMPADGEARFGESFVQAVRRHGWGRFEPELVSLFAASDAHSLTRNAEWLRLLCREEGVGADRRSLCVRLCAVIVEALNAVDGARVEQPVGWRTPQFDRAALLSALVDAMLAVDARAPLRRLVEGALDRPDRYDLTEVHLAAIFALGSGLTGFAASNEPIARWLTACRARLEARTERPPERPKDYRRAHELPCDCVDCRALSRFLADPDRGELRMRLNKARRKHLHRTIDAHRCDLTHVTERHGRPYTLVCAKTTASHERALTTYRRDMKNIARLKEIAAAGG